MTRFPILLISLLLVCFFAPTAVAQLDPVDILERMEAVRQERITNVQNYTLIEKSSAAGTASPSVQYYERATDADGNPVAAFRLVPPHELANREAEARGEATAEERAAGLQGALGAVVGVLGGAATDAGIDVPDDAVEAAMGAHVVLGEIAAGPDVDPNADALAGLEHMETLKEYATYARVGRYHSQSAYQIVASGFEDVELDLGLPEGVQVERMVLWVDIEELVPLKLTVEAQGETDSGESFPIRIEREDFSFQSVSPSAMYEPMCTRGRLNFGGDERSTVFMRRFVEVNQGPQSQEKQRELLADAMEDFENYHCN